MNGNKLAINNGINSESIVKNAFMNEDVEILNDLIDIKINGKFVEIKSCLENVRDNSFFKGFRNGRFNLNKEQHDFLVDNNGYYQFVLNSLDHVIGSKLYYSVRMKFVKANSLEFQKLIMWKKIFDGE